MSLSGLGLGFFYSSSLGFHLGLGKDPCQRRRSGQWDEGSGIRGDVVQWRWGEGRSIWRSMYCFFLSLFSDGDFATFGPSGIEGDSRRWGRLSLQVRCGGGSGGRTGLVKGVIMDMLSCHLGRLFSSDVFVFLFVWGG